MNALLLLLLFPVVWPFIAKQIWHTTINWTEMTIQIVGVVFLVIMVWTLGTYSQTQDVEIWNGEVVSKNRDHGHYIESYPCNCQPVSCGKNCTTTVCQTCTRDHYTVTWSADTTVGDVVFKHLDRSSSSVYNTPNPTSYTNCTIGEPASIEHMYTNYIRAAQDSLFNNLTASTTYEHQIPKYPRVYDFYRYERVIQVNTTIPSTIHNAINDGLNNKLKKLGPSLQINIIVVITGINDPSFRHAVENKWLGGKKNDVVAFIGIDQQMNILWTDAMTFAFNRGNELFQVKLRDGLKDVGNLGKTNEIVNTITDIATNDFTRISMKEFEYLADDIDPPTWVIILSIILAIGGSIALSIVFHKIEVEDVVGQFFVTLRRKFNRRFH